MACLAGAIVSGQYWIRGGLSPPYQPHPTSPSPLTKSRPGFQKKNSKGPHRHIPWQGHTSVTNTPGPPGGRAQDLHTHTHTHIHTHTHKWTNLYRFMLALLLS